MDELPPSIPTTTAAVATAASGASSGPAPWRRGTPPFALPDIVFPLAWAALCAVMAAAIVHASGADASALPLALLAATALSSYVFVRVRLKHIDPARRGIVVPAGPVGAAISLFVPAPAASAVLDCAVFDVGMLCRRTQPSHIFAKGRAAARPATLTTISRGLISMTPIVAFEIALIGASLLTFGVYELRTLARRRAH